MEFRLATDKDVEGIVALVDSAYRGEVSRQGWTTEADLIDGQRTDKDMVLQIMKKPAQQIIVCEDHGGSTGDTLLATVHLDRKQNHAYLGMFAVQPGLQGQGIGRALLKFAEHRVFQEWRCDWLEMTVIQQRQALINWYIRQGYSLSGETREFPYGDLRFGVPKRPDLVLQVLHKWAPQATD